MLSLALEVRLLAESGNILIKLHDVVQPFLSIPARVEVAFRVPRLTPGQPMEGGQDLDIRFDDSALDGHLLSNAWRPSRAALAAGPPGTRCPA